MDGRMIAEKRKAMGLTQDALGAMLGISGKAVSKWEHGLSKPCDEHLAKLIELFGLSGESSPTEKEKNVIPQITFLSTIRQELIRILATGVMLAVCVCNLTGSISTDSTVVFLGFSMALFCFGSMVKESKKNRHP